MATTREKVADVVLIGELESVRVTVTLEVPAAAVPVIAPVEAFRVAHAGSPVADQV
jgi:hypothetical protein